VPANPTEREELVAELGEAKAQIEELKKQLVTALATIERLAAELRKNSSNSSLPPSSDGPGAVSRGVREPKKPKSKRKRGGQKGHRGAHRELLPLKQVDAFVDLYPEVCEGCTRPLAPSPDADARRYQCLELLAEGQHVTQWQRHAVTCPCGHTTRAPYDPEVIPASPFGARLTSVVAALSGVYHLSRRNTQRFFHEVFGIDISLGAIIAMEGRVSAALESASEEAHKDVLAAEVKHADATTWLMAGLTLSLWTLSTPRTTVFRIFQDGARATIEGMFSGADGKHHGVLVSDRASVFGFWSMVLRQVCWAHLLRLFIGFSQRAGPMGRFGRELLEHASLVFEYWHGFISGELSPEELQRRMLPVQRRFEALLTRIVAADIRGFSGSCANLLAHAEALWTFVDTEGVEPTNNLAERDLRSFVIWRRLCYGSQSESGLRFVERIMTVAMTLRKRGRGVLRFIERCVTAHFSGTQAPALLSLEA